MAIAACSIAAGFTGMKAATHANVRTAQAANQRGQGPALMMYFLVAPCGPVGGQPRSARGGCTG